MRILHTADWHIGRTLYGRRRYEEFEFFLNWLVAAVHREEADVLLIAGDVFDTIAPSNRSQELYYGFLHAITASHCRHVVITGGNHDSPSFLNAPKSLLAAMNVLVVGSACENPDDEVLVLRDGGGVPELIVCAVPYLRDRDIRTVEAGESIHDKERKLQDGIRAHYEAVASIAEQRRAEAGDDVPVVGMGHLFTADGRTVEGDGVRDLYVGTLAHVAASAFPSSFDYLALGHLHVPQLVGGRETARYSGSPIPMGFGEAGHQKSICRVDFAGRTPSVTVLEVPVFQKLVRVRGDWSSIVSEVRTLVTDGVSVWLEVVYEGNEMVSNLRERVDELVADSCVEVLRVRNNRVIQGVLRQTDSYQSLDDLSELEVFERCLASRGVEGEQREDLILAYKEVLTSLHEEDLRAE